MALNNLAELDPKFITLDGRRGIRFLCPNCRTHQVRVTEPEWEITGELPNVTIYPSIQSDDPNCNLHISVVDGKY